MGPLRWFNPPLTSMGDYDLGARFYDMVTFLGRKWGRGEKKSSSSPPALPFWGLAPIGVTPTILGVLAGSRAQTAAS